MTSAMTEPWIAILRLATQWQFDDIRKKAIETLASQGITSMQSLRLGRQYFVSDWLINVYVDLASREDSDPLTEDEEKLLGDAAVVKLFKIKTERRRAEDEGSEFDLRAKVEEWFKEELMADETYRCTNLP